MGQKIFRNRIGNKLGPKLILSRFLSAEAASILKRSRRCCWSEAWSDIFWQNFWPEKFNRWWFQVCSIDLSQKCYGLNLFLRKKRFTAHFQISLSGLSVVPVLKLIQVLLIRAPLRCQMSEPSLTWIKLRFVFCNYQTQVETSCSLTDKPFDIKWRMSPYKKKQSKTPVQLLERMKPSREAEIRTHSNSF